MPKSLLVIDPVATNRISLAALFEGAQYDVTTAASFGDFKGPQCPADLVVLGLHGDQPAKTIASLKTMSIPSDTPLLCIDVDTSPLRRLLVLRAGARDVMPRSTPDALILARLRGLIRDGDAERECERRRMTAASFGFAEASAGFEAAARIACVASNDAMPTLPQMLASTLPHCIESFATEDVLRDLEGTDSPDAYVIVSGQNYRSIDALLPELRDRSHSRHAPVIVIYPGDRPDIATRALALGASEIATETSSGEELGLRIAAMLKRKRLRDALRRSDEQSYRLAATDPLTGLYNRRYAEAYLGDLMMRSGEFQRGFAMMIVDLDHFKSVNDRFGHASGDRVLCEVAYRLRDNLRAGDLVSRHGGEEFLVILPDASREQVAHTAERLRAAIAAAPVVAEHGAIIDVTASIGVATGDISAPNELQAVRTGTFDLAEPRTPPALSRVFDAADVALYTAKNNGRNRVAFSAA